LPEGWWFFCGTGALRHWGDRVAFRGDLVG
jgi:hypothetical protein